MSAILYELDVEGGLQLTYSRLDQKPTDRDFEEYLQSQRRRIRELHKQGRKEVMIVDLTNVPPQSPTQRRMHTEWVARNEELVRSVTLGLAFVVTSRTTRGILHAIFWFKPPPSQHRICDSLDEALTWGFELFDRAGVRVSGHVQLEAERKLRERASLAGEALPPSA
ncbi:MAG: hypothetical protein ABW321_35025 [Polyangiales bacterium]